MVLEVTIISAESLTINHRHVSSKKSLFVIVYTDLRRSLASTKPVVAGGSYPEWNQQLSVQTPVRSLTLEVRCSDNKVVGTVTIPKSDFARGYLPADYLHFLSYRLRNSKGEPNGIINMSVRALVPSNGDAISWTRPWMEASSGVPISSM